MQKTRPIWWNKVGRIKITQLKQVGSNWRGKRHGRRRGLNVHVDWRGGVRWRWGNACWLSGTAGCLK